MRTEFRASLAQPVHRHHTELRAVATVLWALLGLFGLRVAGQAIQLWVPQPFLPPFEAFQGSLLPYPLLLCLQLALAAWMGHLAWRVSAGELTPRRRAGRILAWFGWIYFAAMLARLVIGRAFDTGSAWFEAWIPALFHLVLAAFVLTLSRYHLRSGFVPRRQEA